MITATVFELPAVWSCAAPLALLLGLAAWRQRRRGLAVSRVLAAAALRGIPLLALICLAARPVRLGTETSAAAARPVVVLVDRSESMSLKDADSTRYQRALDFLSRRLLPALKSAGLPVQGMLFDQSAELADGPQMLSARPNGKRTNLGGAIVQALGNSVPPPLVIIALTDGIANDGSDNARAMGALVDSKVPFIGVGFGADQGVQTLSLRRVEAPTSVAPRTAFSISAELELMNADEPVDFDLMLFRDGQVVQKKSVTPAKASRTWLESFRVNGEADGSHTYLVQLLPPNVPNLKCVNTADSAPVTVSDEKDLRVLYIQGALTWDYKFIGLALRNDSGVKLTGLTRTSKQAVFRQNVESTSELVNGFPSSLQELSPFRVVVLANLRPDDFNPAQQEMLARFCGELGGGLLMIGGAGTFDSSWQNSRLEQLLPVVFSASLAPGTLDQSFRVQLTDEALQEPLFQLGDDRPVREQWRALPAFSQFGKVDSAKLGAQVWMMHPGEEGQGGQRILMASQRYGAGLSAVLCIQNFWRWRLAKDSDPQQFDRFWRQLFRWLGERGRQEVSIQFADQELRPQTDVQVLLERQSNPQNLMDTNLQFRVQVEDSRNHLQHEETVELRPFQPVDFKFRALNPDLYTLKVLDSANSVIASRPIEIRDTDIELDQTARNMETLRQWASVTDGLAFKVEECPKAVDLVAQIKSKVEEVRNARQTRRPAGLNWWSLSLILGSLAGEWLLRKKWGLI